MRRELRHRRRAGWGDLERACDSWSMDAATWRLDFLAKKVSITHWHLRQGSRQRGTFQDIIYRIATEQFDSYAHSSYSCTDPGRTQPQRLHCPRGYFIYDREAEPPEPEAVQQGVLV